MNPNTKTSNKSPVLSAVVPASLKQKIQERAVRENRTASQITLFCLEEGYSTLYGEEETRAANQDQ